MAASVKTSSPLRPKKEGASFMATAASASASSPKLSPSSDKSFWSNLRNRIDVILEEQQAPQSPSTSRKVGGTERAKRLKEDSMLLVRGIDSMAHTLSQLSNNLETALQGVRELAKPPTLTEILQTSLTKSDEPEQAREEEDKGLKRKYEIDVCSDEQADDSSKGNERPKDKHVMKKAKNIAISMATKAALLTRELQSIKSELSSMQERCSLLEEENRRLRQDGFVKEDRAEDDDLVRLQLEALLAEKSRLANENANLVRENQCLSQLVEYHKITSQDLSASYEQVMQGLCLDFSSPLPGIDEVQNTPGSPSTCNLESPLCFEKED